MNFRYTLLIALFSIASTASALYYPDDQSSSCSDTIEFRDINRIFDHLQRRFYSQMHTIEGCDLSGIFSTDSIQTPTNPLFAHIRDRSQLSQFASSTKSEISKRIKRIKAKTKKLIILPLSRTIIQNFTRIFENNMLRSLTFYIKMINDDFSGISPLFSLTPTDQKEVEDLFVEFFELSKQFPSDQVEDQQKKVLNLISLGFLGKEFRRTAEYHKRAEARLSDSD